MKTGYGIILVLAMAAVIMLSILPCSAHRMGEEKKEDIWTKDEPRGPGGDPREGPRRGPGPGRRRFELTDEEIDRIMKGLKERDPAKAKELAELREKEPEKFREELREVAREEFGKVMRERIKAWMLQRQAEFLEWLEKNFRKEAKELSRLKDRDPDLYWKKFDIVRKKYWLIFEEERRNPELAKVLKEKLKLNERRDRLVREIRAASDEKKRKALIERLKEVISSRFDLIVREKQIAYKRLLKRLEELKKRIEESRDEIIKWRNDKFKADEVEKRIEDLTEGRPGLKWD
jgi:RNA-binding protein 25